MKEVLEMILNDEDHPGDANGKKVSLMTKFGMQLMGGLARGPQANIYKIKALMQANDKAKPDLMWVYFNAEDVAIVFAPEPEGRISIASTTDISKLRAKF